MKQRVIAFVLIICLLIGLEQAFIQGASSKVINVRFELKSVMNLECSDISVLETSSKNNKNPVRFVNKSALVTLKTKNTYHIQLRLKMNILYQQDFYIPNVDDYTIPISLNNTFKEASYVDDGYCIDYEKGKIGHLIPKLSNGEVLQRMNVSSSDCAEVMKSTTTEDLYFYMIKPGKFDVELITTKKGENEQHSRKITVEIKKWIYKGNLIETDTYQIPNTDTQLNLQLDDETLESSLVYDSIQLTELNGTTIKQDDYHLIKLENNQLICDSGQMNRLIYDQAKFHINARIVGNEYYEDKPIECDISFAWNQPDNICEVLKNPYYDKNYWYNKDIVILAKENELLYEWEGNRWVQKDSIEIIGEGNTEKTIRINDNVYKQLVFRIDKTKPTTTRIVNSIPYKVEENQGIPTYYYSSSIELFFKSVDKESLLGKEKAILLAENGESLEGKANYIGISSPFKGKLQIELSDLAGNILSFCDGNYVVDDTKMVKPTVTMWNQKPEEKNNFYSAGSWTQDNVIIRASIATKDTPLAGIEYLEYTNQNPTESSCQWNRLEFISNQQETYGELILTEDTNDSFYFRALSNTGVVGEMTEGIRVCIQKSPLVKAMSSIEPESPDGNEQWYVSFPRVDIKHPTSEQYTEKMKTLITYYQLITQTTKQEKIIADRQFSRLFSNHEVMNNIENPVITQDGIYRLDVWTENGLSDKHNSTIEFKVDTTKPTVNQIQYEKDGCGFSKIIENDKSPIYYYHNMMKINLICSDEVGEIKSSGISYYEYQFVQERETIQQNRWIRTENSLITVNDTFAGRIVARCVDRAGNVSDIVMGDSFIIDNETPKVSFLDAQSQENSYEEGTWVNDPVIIVVNASSVLSGIDTIEYTTVDSPAEEDWIPMESTTKAILHQDHQVQYVKDRIVIDYDTNKTYQFRVRSNSGLVSDVESIQIKVQKTLPQNGSFSVTPDKINASQQWYTTVNPTIQIQQSSFAMESSVDAMTTVYYQVWNETIGETEQTSPICSITEEMYKIEQVLSQDGVYHIKVWAKDEAGNQCKLENGEEAQSYMVKVDLSKPIGQIVIENQIYEERQDRVYFGTFYQTRAQIAIQATDGTSGIHKIEYQRVNKEEDFSVNGPWKEYSGEFYSRMNEKMIIYSRIIDEAGNQTIINSQGVIVDSEKPVSNSRDEIQIDLNTINEQGFGNRDVNATIEVVDPTFAGNKKTINGSYSGLKEVSYQIIVNGVEKEKKVLFHFSKEKPSYLQLVGCYRGKVTLSCQNYESNDVQLVVNAIDNAGNTSRKKVLVKLDQTAPKIRLTYSNQSTDRMRYYNQDRIAHIAIEEKNFSGNQVDVYLMKDGVISICQQLEWKHKGNLHQVSIPITEDGEYQFQVRCEDLAGNKADFEEKESFIIDQTKPEIEVVYDSTRTTNYYNVTRIATITVIDKNFSSNSYIEWYNENGEVRKTQCQWVHKDSVHKTTIEFEEDGFYEYNIYCEDLSGNRNSLTKNESFYLDRTAPKVNIFGVMNQSANNGELKPCIEIIDENQRLADVQVSLVGANRGKIKVKDGSQKAKNEFLFQFDVFEEKKEMDDLYTLTVKAIDLAGNQTVKNIQFSVNRYGSVYSASDDTKSKLDCYNQTISEDLIFLETNIDVLDEYFVKYSKNGIVYDMVEHEDYEVHQIGQSKSWKQYEYTIDKSLFEEDGYYRISFYSRDKAKNSSDNQLKNSEFEFVVDHTAPVCVISGIESKQSYNSEKEKVQIKVFDNGELSKIKVMLNGIQKEEWLASQINEVDGIFEMEIGSLEKLQNLEVIAIDAAGNETRKTVNDFLITTNQWLQFYNNKPLYFGTMGGSTTFLCLTTAILFMRRRKRKVVVE